MSECTGRLEDVPTFSPATQAWLDGAFDAPTAAQTGAWHAIARGDHTLVVAPTGSGKTLAAFLSALDRLATRPIPDDPMRRCRVLYVSPLKALAVDVERNLRSPLTGIAQAAARLGLQQPRVTVAMRSGDTPADERRAFARHPADILITTPESLFLLLTSAAREALRGIDTVIVDEVHAVCATKRGAHLALSLERLDALLEAPAQRIGLSATVRPVDEVATFLAGGRPVTIVQPPVDKVFDLQVVVPIEDMSSLGELSGDLSGAAAGAPRRTSIWPHVEERVLDLIEAHQSSIVFANSRRLAERLTARLNELATERAGAPLVEPARMPAEVIAQSGSGHPAGDVAGDIVVARAHHGSVSREQRVSSRKTSKQDAFRLSWRPPPSNWASTWARWTSSFRSNRRHRWPPGSSASGEPDTRSEPSRVASSFRSFAATCSSAPWWPSGCVWDRSSRCATPAIRSMS